MFTNVTTSLTPDQPNHGVNIKYHIITKQGEKSKESFGNKVKNDYIIDGRFWTTNVSANVM